MSTNRCAVHRSIFCILIIIAPFVSSIVRADDTIIATVILNQQDGGEYYVIKADDGDFLVRSDDLNSMGLSVYSGRTEEIDGERYVSLRSVGGIEYVFDEKALSLNITAPPSMFPSEIIDFTPQRQRNVEFPKDSSAFLNYSVDYLGADNNKRRNLGVTNELGVRIGDFLAYSDSFYTYNNTNNRFVRLMSNVTYDRRNDLARLIFGDFYASSSELGSTLNLGGVSFRKEYSMDPYFIKYPMIDFAGVVTTPSEVEIYRNGVLVGRKYLSPGEFELRNIASYGGAGTLETVIKDPFGREQHFSQPYYFTNILLRKGLHDYSYNAGFLREDYGIKNAKYGKPTVSAYHRYGFIDAITAGLAGEAGKGRYNAGPEASFLLGRFGTLTLLGAGSLDDNGWEKGAAGTLSYEYQGRTISVWLSLAGYTQNFRDINTIDSPFKTKMQGGGGAGFTTMRFGSISFDLVDIERYNSANSQLIGSVSYSRNLWRMFFASATYRVTNDDNDTNHEIFAGLSFYPGKKISVSGNYQRSDEIDTGILQIMKNPPYGEGLGYRASIERTQKSYVFDPFVQYNSNFGIHKAEYTGSYNGGTINSFNVSTAGSLAYVGKTLKLTRPINDSFALVRTGDLKDIGIFVSSQKVGKTSKSGKAIIPDLNSYYDNRISIDAGEIPIDYNIPQATKYISPAFRSGSLIDFEVKKLNAATGMLKIKTASKVVPLEFYEVSITAGDKEIVFPTGRGGEFYIEDINPGSYNASFEYNGKACGFELVIPERDEPIVDVGEIVYKN